MRARHQQRPLFLNNSGNLQFSTLYRHVFIITLYIYMYMCIIFTYCPAFQGVAHILSDKAPAQATVRANQLASGCGSQNLSEVLASTADLSLASSEDITKSVLESERTCGPTLPSSRISMRKAALLGFQTWHTRAPGIGGSAFGQRKQKGCGLLQHRGGEEWLWRALCR